jgi:hypothetical protein
LYELEVSNCDVIVKSTCWYKRRSSFSRFSISLFIQLKNVGNVNVLKTIKTIKKYWNDHFVKTTYGIKNPKACRGDV